MEKRKINYNNILPDYIKCFMSQKEFEKLKYIGDYFREKKLNRYGATHLSNLFVNDYINGITFSHLNPDEKKIVTSFLLYSDEDIYNVLTDEDNTDLFVGLGYYFTCANELKRYNDSKSFIKEECLNAITSFVENYSLCLVSAFAKYFNVREDSIISEILINRINCVFSFQYNLLFSSLSRELIKNKKNG